MRFKNIPCKGFTLIELAIVLFILGLLLGTILPPLSAQVEQREREKTQSQLDEIKAVIFGYVLRNGYLPCPDIDNDGVEDRNAGIPDECLSAVGNLPWVDLGVEGTDAWGNNFIYAVDVDYADRGVGSDGAGPCTDTTLNVSFALCSEGNITILDSAGGANVATNIPAIVVSMGKNGSIVSEHTAHELENTDGDLTFVYKDYSKDDVLGFDDMLIWISPHILRTKMLNAGILP